MASIAPRVVFFAVALTVCAAAVANGEANRVPFTLVSLRLAGETLPTAEARDNPAADPEPENPATDPSPGIITDLADGTLLFAGQSISFRARPIILNDLYVWLVPRFALDHPGLDISSHAAVMTPRIVFGRRDDETVIRITGEIVVNETQPLEIELEALGRWPFRSTLLSAEPGLTRMPEANGVVWRFASNPDSYLFVFPPDRWQFRPDDQAWHNRQTGLTLQIHEGETGAYKDWTPETPTNAGVTDWGAYTTSTHISLSPDGSRAIAAVEIRAESTAPLFIYSIGRAETVLRLRETFQSLQYAVTYRRRVR